MLLINLLRSLCGFLMFGLHLYLLLDLQVAISFREGLGEAYDEDIAFASAVETFGGGHNDPISVAFGGG